MRLRPETLFSLALVVLFAWAVWEARNWPLQARLMPWVVGIPMTVLALAQLVADLRGVEQKRSGFESEFGEGLEPAVVRRRVLTILGWIGGFFLLIHLVGFLIAVPLGTFLYLRVGSHESWRLSLLLSAIAAVLFYGIFGYGLNTPFPEGLLFSLLPLGD